jgi:predicted site-specific integrase-resolvase
MEEKVYKVSDLAKMFNVNGETIKNWTKKYDIHFTVTAGGHWRYDEESINEINNIINERYNLKRGE